MSVEILNDDVKTVERFCNFENAINTSGDSQMTLVARTRIGWMRFGECGDVLSGRRFFVQDKRKSISYLCKIGNTVWKRSMVFDRKRSGIVKN